MEINIDILEIVLSQIYEMNCVLNGTLTLALKFLKPDTSPCYLTETLFRHASLAALEPELLANVIDLISTPDEEFIKNLTESKEERLKLKGINMFYVKYSHIDFNLVQYYHSLYQRLEEQTNNLDPVELGKRIIILPNNIPETFDGIVKIFENLSEDFKLCSKFIKSHYNLDLDEDFKNMTSLNEFLNLHGTYYPNMETYKKNICEFMAPQQDPSGLRLENLERYRVKYNACIKVDSENYRLYTRARFILNMFVELNDHLMKHLVNSPGKAYNDDLSRLHEYIGIAARSILTHQQTLYLDDGNYPIIPELYCSGIITERYFPESINYTKIQKLCFCLHCQPFKYSALLYEGNDGNVYVLVNLREQNYNNYINFLEKLRCMYNLFMADIEYHYGRVEALDAWRYKLEVAKNRISMSIEKLIKLLNEIGGQDWFSPIRRAYMRMEDANRMYLRLKSDV